MLIDLGLIGVFGGFFIVPLYALCSSARDAKSMSRVIGANNILNAVFMVAAACSARLPGSWLTVPQLLLATGS